MKTNANKLGSKSDSDLTFREQLASDIFRDMVSDFGDDEEAADRAVAKADALIAKLAETQEAKTRKEHILDSIQNAMSLCLGGSDIAYGHLMNARDEIAKD